MSMGLLVVRTIKYNWGMLNNFRENVLEMFLLIKES